MKKLNLHQNRISTYADKTVYASWSGDCINGKKGTARAKSGGKKYIRTRIRFNENQQLQKDIKNLVMV